MHPTDTREGMPLRSGLVLLSTVVLSACQLQPSRDAADAAPLSAAQRAKLEKTVAVQQNSIMALELQLLAERSEVQQLAYAREQAIQEVVRAKAKLRSRNGKAETVANLAEVKLTLESLRAGGGARLQTASLDRAAKYIAMSEAALADGNIDGAAYLAGQARVSLDAANVRPSRQSPGSGDIAHFSAPQRMTVGQRSNVRAGPGNRHQVLYQLDAGSVVRATGYRRLWVRIIGDDDRPDGWIHYRLLDARL